MKLKPFCLLAVLVFTSILSSTAAYAEGDPVPVTGIAVTSQDDADTVTVGNTLQLYAVVTPQEATDHTVSWTSSDAAIAEVDESGMVTAVTAGTVTITATANDGSGVFGTIELSVCFFPGSGTLDAPYDISSANDLMRLALLVNTGEEGYADASYSLSADIDASGISNWPSIGETQANAFRGSLDGNGFAVKGLVQTISTNSTVYGGLFGYAEGAVIQDVGTEDCAINLATSSGSCFAGGIVGFAGPGTTIKNCYSTGSVTTSILSGSPNTWSMAGGIAGRVHGDLTAIDQCYNTGTVNALSSSDNSFSMAGGIAGHTSCDEIQNSYNTGTVHATNSNAGTAYAGGIAGEITVGTISGCHSAGQTLAAVSRSVGITGNIAGYQNDGTITNCYNETSVILPESTGSYGGLVGYMYDGVIQDCNNSGNFTLSSRWNVGGIAGTGCNGQIINCRNSGDILRASGGDLSGSYIGGIAGSMQSITIDHCYNTGNLNGGSVGGIIGWLDGQQSSILNCYNTGSVNGKLHAGGIAGILVSSGISISKCYNLGTITAVSATGGVAGSGDSNLTNCFYLDVNSRGVGTGTDRGTKISLDQITQQSTFAGFDFSAVWTIRNTCHFPELLSNNHVKTVVFNSLGGSLVESTSTDNDSTITAPTPPARPGYAFSGWYKDPGCSTAWNFAGDTVKGNILLYAGWDTANYTVQFDLRGHGQIDDVTTGYLSTIAEPAVPDRSGYTVTGWYKDAACSSGQQWHFADDAVTADMTLFALWTANTYTVAFDLQYGTADPETKDAVFGSSYGTLPEPTRTGYTFGGWYGNSGCTGIAVTAATAVTTASNHTVYAKWSANTYTVAFDLQYGAADPETKNAVFGSPYGTLPVPTRTGYTFGGWYWNSGCTGIAVTAATAVTTASNHTLYAKWSPNTYRVTFAALGGQVSPETKDVVFAGFYGPLPEPSRAGYTFGEWYWNSGCTGSPATVEATVTTAANHTLYAKWSANTYTVAFDLQYSAADPESKHVLFGSPYGTLPVPIRTGYAFGGWYGNSGCTGETVTAATAVTTASDHTLYARWATSVCTVSFNSQLGSAVSSKQAQYNSTIAAPAPPTRSGYVFCGWFKEPTCKTPWNFAADKVTGSVTLYAKWVSTIPTSPKATVTSYANVTVIWAAVPGASGYEVWRSTSSASGFARVKTTSSTAFADSGLVAGKTYYYMVLSYAGSVKSGFSAVVSAKPIPAALASAKAAPVTYNSIKITWAAVAGATKYEVYRATSAAGSYKLIGTATATNYTNKSTGTGITYYYKVRAYRLAGGAKVYGGYSPVVTAKTGMAAPATIKAARASATSIKVTWAKVAGATKYELWLGTSANGTYTLVRTTTSLSYTNTKLTTGVTYYYRVRCYHLEGSAKVYSGWTKVVQAKP